MTLTLAFWAPFDVSEAEQRADVERQAREWAEAEPKVTACRIVRVWRPMLERPSWWHVTVDLDIEQAHPNNLTLWEAAS